MPPKFADDVQIVGVHKLDLVDRPALELLENRERVSGVSMPSV